MAPNVRAAIIVCITAMIAAAPARAESRSGFAVSRFEPAARGGEWFAADSLDLRGNLRPAAGIVTDYTYRSLVVHRPDDSVVASPLRNMLLAHLGGSLVLRDRVRVSANLPLQLFADGHDAKVGPDVVRAPAHEQGIGDLRLGADVRVFGTRGDVATAAAGVDVWLPTGAPGQYTSDGDEWRLRPRATIAGEVIGLVYSGQLYVQYRSRQETSDGGDLGSEIGLVLAAGVRLANRRLLLGPELLAATALSDPFGKRTAPVEGLLGAHYSFGTLQAGAGVGAGLTRGFGSPEMRALLSIQWTPVSP